MTSNSATKVARSITIEDVRNAVADELEAVGHGNLLFIQSVREGGQDDGPFMRGAMAVMKMVVSDLAEALQV